MGKFNEMEEKLNSMSPKKLKEFIASYSSELRNRKEHCCDLRDQETNRPYMTSVLGSGLNVINNTTAKMSEETQMKAKAIIAYAENTFNHNYSKDELLFVKGYLSLEQNSSTII